MDKCVRRCSQWRHPKNTNEIARHGTTRHNHPNNRPHQIYPPPTMMNNHALSSSSNKENANPDVYRVESKRQSWRIPKGISNWIEPLALDESVKSGLSSSVLSSDPSKTPILQYDPPSLLDPRSVNDLAVVRALQDTASLLQKSSMSSSSSSPSSSLLLLNGGDLQLRQLPDQPTILVRNNHRNDKTKPTSVLPPVATYDRFTAEEIFGIIRNVQDPEHPLTLEQLNVVNRDHVQVHDHYGSNPPKVSTVDVRFT